MNRFAAGVIISLLALLFLTPAESRATWIPDGVPVCTAAGAQYAPRMISDGSGGWFVAWGDQRDGYKIYAQHLNALGAPIWTADGILLGSGSDFLDLVSDGTGGVIIAWARSDVNSAIFAQRLNASGAALWAAGGVHVNVMEFFFTDYGPHIVSDGAGGAIIAWTSYLPDGFGGWVSNISAQRLSASGTRLWNGDYAVEICGAEKDQFHIDIATDGAGGAILSWADLRNDDGSYFVEVYAQRVNAAGVTQWTTNGVAVCAGAENCLNYDIYPKITVDGAGGAIIAWEELDCSGGNRPHAIYAQRLNSLGSVQWTTNGIPVCTATGERYGPLVVSDGSGGAVVAWAEARDSSYGLFAQLIDASGALQWTSDGAILCTTGEFIYTGGYDLCSDDEGGAVIAWSESGDIYSQRMTAAGELPWGSGGVVVCSASLAQYSPDIDSNGLGGAAVAWWDFRNASGSSNYDIYAGFVNPSGGVGELGPAIASVLDVPQDQGGWVRITIDKSHLDDEAIEEYPISLYNVWQRVDNPVLLAAIEGSAVVAAMTELPVVALKDRVFLRAGERIAAADMPPGTWELLGSFAACQHDQYIYRASTLADSTAAGIPYSVYMVSAHTTAPSVWFVSSPDSGYSVDNLSPEPPEKLVAEQSFVPEGLSLEWDMNRENDLSHYAVYRGLSEDFVPAPGNRVASPTEPEWFDGDWRWDAGYYYKISAVDENGNESGYALVRPDDLTGTETPKTPAASFLAQNFPNPFNPTTKIAFGLAAPADVSLRIYDAAGRLVRALVEGARPAGNYSELWDGRDSGGRAVSSGIYFYRLTAGAFTETRKMALLR